MKNFYLKLSLFTLVFVQSIIGIAQTYVGDVTLNTQAEVDAFGANGYTEVTGELFIGVLGDIINLDSISSDIVDLSSLNTLTTVGGQMSIYNNQNLTTLTGLENLTTLQSGLHINLNFGLTSISALSNITTVNGNLTILMAHELASLEGLNNLTHVSNGLFIQETAITTLDGLNNIDSVGDVLTISHNPNLISLKGLENLNTVGVIFWLYENPSLVALEGINNLNSIPDGSIHIFNNNSLANYCAINANALSSTDFNIYSNLLNPTYNDLLNGDCVDCSLITIDNSTSPSAEVIQLTANQDGATYQWLRCDDGYEIIEGETNQSIQPTTTGYYGVEINLFGCLDTSYCTYVTIPENLEPEYCDITSTRNRYEWIKQVELGTNIDNLTGRESSGYGDYSDQVLLVDTGDVVSVNLTPGYRRRAYVEYWRIWVDWNNDGDFNGLGEKVFEQKGKHVRTGSFTVPVEVSPYDLRMRVAMRWRRYAPSCGSFSSGEVEDYSIRVNGAKGPIVIVPFKQGIEETEETIEGLVEIAELDVNPVAKGQPISGYIRTEKEEVVHLNVVNILGQTVKTEQISTEEGESYFEINSENLTSGVYFINANSNQETIKVVIR